ncbi:hypothetical protein M0812_25196 [Anaeramoeba flamelloides]|uniref:Uncharacterized protein n=1 Tax=Anaeramoeba flamelloides TaxID=1746091 RepID=A0AAV7YG64_9EUKA|nr:hypothetical protein M0812_25196 [Anaeramoeba flamelloides]
MKERTELQDFHYPRKFETPTKTKNFAETNEKDDLITFLLRIQILMVNDKHKKNKMQYQNQNQNQNQIILLLFQNIFFQTKEMKIISKCLFSNLQICITGNCFNIKKLQLKPSANDNDDNNFSIIPDNSITGKIKSKQERGKGLKLWKHQLNTILKNTQYGSNLGKLDNNIFLQNLKKLQKPKYLIVLIQSKCGEKNPTNILSEWNKIKNLIEFFPFVFIIISDVKFKKTQQRQIPEGFNSFLYLFDPTNWDQIFCTESQKSQKSHKPKEPKEPKESKESKEPKQMKKRERKFYV